MRELLNETQKVDMTEGRHSRNKCMECDNPPTAEILWAEGKAHAWFGDKCFKKWKNEGDGWHEVDALKKIINGEASKKFSDNKTPNLKEAVEATQEEKEKHFEERTNKHIKLVQKAAAKIVKVYPEFEELNMIVKDHDASKLNGPEREPYIEISWRHKIENEGGQYDPYNGKGYQTPGQLEKEDENKATLDHIKGNQHHPEYWSSDKANISKTNRDESIECIDASNMPDIAIAEMVSDWQAMSIELGTNTARQWYEKTKDSRWSYSSKQEELIDRLLAVFEDEIKETKGIRKIIVTSLEGPPGGYYAVNFKLVQDDKTYEYRADAPQVVIKDFQRLIRHRHFGKAMKVIRNYIPKEDKGQIELF